MKLQPHGSRITLIGMAGIGKSTWAGRLRTSGYQWIDCDRLIAESLSIRFPAGEDLIKALGEWMGLPWEEEYGERAGLYQVQERAVMARVIDSLGGSAPGAGRVVIDTAGSVIYTGMEILEKLASKTLMVHLETPSDVRNKMLEDYIKRPGPVIWDGLFERKAGEPVHAALARCYPRLLEERERRYREVAHVTIPHSIHRGHGTTLEEFISFSTPGQAPEFVPQGE